MRRSSAPSQIGRRNLSNLKEVAVLNVENKNDIESLYIKPECNPSEDMRIFRILWREQTQKKHKTWKDDGTLEVTDKRAVLRDSTGKYVCSETLFKQIDFEPDLQMVIANKEIEIQNEIESPNEFSMHQRELLRNRTVKQEEEVDEAKASLNHVRPVFKRKFLPVTGDASAVHSNENCLPPPLKRSTNTGALDNSEVMCWGSKREMVSTKPDEISHYKKTEYICLLQSSELQTFIQKTCYDFCIKNKEIVLREFTTSSKLLELCQRICDHPVLLQQDESDKTQLMQHLVNTIPEWSEMSVYDAAKFEFIETILNRFVCDKTKKFVVIVKETSAIDILKGYCDFIEMNSIIVDDNTDPMNYGCLINRFNVTLRTDPSAPRVAFIKSNIKIPVNIKICNSNQFIFYNYMPQNSEFLKHVKPNDSVHIYNLITTGYEENLFLKQLADPDIDANDTSVDTIIQLLNVEDCIGDKLSDHMKNIENGSNNILRWTDYKPLSNISFSQSSRIDVRHLQSVFSKSSLF